MKVIYIPEVAEDIDEIHSYLMRKETVELADNIIDELLDTIDSLDKFPERGNYVSELSILGEKGFRELHYKVFRIIYTVRDNAVLILMVVDSRRELLPLLEERGIR